MEVLNVGNVVKSKTNDTLMIINKRYIDKDDFNKEAIGYIVDGKDTNESIIYRYVCFIEEPNGLTKKLEFKRDELIFVRAAY